MNTKRVFWMGLVAILAFAGSPQAEDDEDIKLIPGGYFLWDYGNVVEGRDENLIVRQNEWYYGLLGGLLLDVIPNEHMLHRANIEIISKYPYPRDPGANGGEVMQNARWTVAMEEAKTMMKLGDAENPTMDFEIGVFVHKTNRATRHFGDYLFRSMIYPAVVFTNFNYPKAKLTGARIGHRVGESFEHNLFTLIETKHYPFFDLSLAYTASYNLMNFLELGAGVNLRAIVPVRPSLTTPELNSTTIKLNNVFWEVTFDPNADTDGNGIPDGQDADPKNIYPVQDVDPVTGVVTLDTAEIDTSVWGPRGTAGMSQTLFNDDGIIYPNVPHTATIYDFSGTLLMARAAVYPLGFLEDAPVDVSVYGETAILGYKNYKHLYENRGERSPYMLGLSIETPIIDVISAEMEVFKSKEPQTYQQRAKFNLPHPGSNAQTQGQGNWENDDFKWMFYMKKQFPGFSLVFLTGVDHLRIPNQSGETYQEILQTPGHWYWQMRFSTAVGK